MRDPSQLNHTHTFNIRILSRLYLYPAFCNNSLRSAFPLPHMIYPRAIPKSSFHLSLLLSFLEYPVISSFSIFLLFYPISRIKSFPFHLAWFKLNPPPAFSLSQRRSQGGGLSSHSPLGEIYGFQGGFQAPTCAAPPLEKKRKLKAPPDKFLTIYAPVKSA